MSLSEEKVDRAISAIEAVDTKANTKGVASPVTKTEQDLLILRFQEVKPKKIEYGAYGQGQYEVSAEPPSVLQKSRTKVVTNNSGMKEDTFITLRVLKGLGGTAAAPAAAPSARAGAVEPSPNNIARRAEEARARRVAAEETERAAAEDRARREAELKAQRNAANKAYAEQLQREFDEKTARKLMRNEERSRANANGIYPSVEEVITRLAGMQVPNLDRPIPQQKGGAKPVKKLTKPGPKVPVKKAKFPRSALPTDKELKSITKSTYNLHFIKLRILTKLRKYKSECKKEAFEKLRTFEDLVDIVRNQTISDGPRIVSLLRQIIKQETDWDIRCSADDGEGPAGEGVVAAEEEGGVAGEEVLPAGEEGLPAGEEGLPAGEGALAEELAPGRVAEQVVAIESAGAAPPKPPGFFGGLFGGARRGRTRAKSRRSRSKSRRSRHLKRA